MLRPATYHLADKGFTGLAGRVTGYYTAEGVEYLRRKEGPPLALEPTLRAAYVYTRLINYADRATPHDGDEFIVVVGPPDEIEQLAVHLRALADAEEAAVEYLKATY